MELNRRRVVVLAVMVAWSVACTGLYYRWEAVVRHFSINTGADVKGPERVPLQNQTSGAGSPSTQRLPKTRTAGTLQPLNGTRPPVSLPRVKEEEEEEDDLVLRAEAFTGHGSAGEKQKQMRVVQQGAVVRRINTSGLGRQDGWGLLSGLVQNGSLDYRDVARYLLKDEYLTSMDREILADDPIQDLSTVASPKHSLLELVGGTRQERKEVRVGHNVTVRIVVRDRRGRAVLKGGHQVRVRMVGRGQPVRLASVDVSDLRNGTYTATLPVLWPGSVEVEAAVQRPREFRRSILSAMAIMKMMNMVVASFISGRKEEVTLCSVIPVVPGYQQLCNLTSLNSDLPWYCGRPATPGLRCRDWALSSHTAFPARYPLSAAENDVIFHSLPPSKNCIRDEKLKQTILLTAVQEPQDLKRVSNQTCRPLKPEETWEDDAQKGYWEGSTWRPLAGCPLPRPSGPVVLDCLRDTHYIAIGDSNAQRTQGCMQGWTHCPSVPAHKRSRILNNNLHVPVTFRCAQRNTRLTWYPHAYPFFTGQGQWSDARVKISPRRILSALPDTGKYVILIHLYTHFSQVHTYVYAQHVRDAARGVRELLARNSKVKVFLLGPHAMDEERFPLLGDFFAERSLRVLKHEFRGLRDRVVLLNTLDMSKAINNCPIHPPLGAIPCQMIISHLCPR